MDQSAKSVAEADDFHAKNVAGGLAHAANRGVQARTIAAAGQDADLFRHVLDPRQPGVHQQL